MKILIEKAVVEQALEALESKLGETHPFAYDLEKAAAIRTLREALAEPELWYCNKCGKNHCQCPPWIESNYKPVEQAEQEPVLYPVRRGSRITCIESGEKCVVWATSHTDCWVQFPDGHAGQYTYEQIGKYFSIEENQAADEAYERGSKEGIEAGKKTEQAEQEPVAEVVLRNQTVGFGRTEERKDVMFLANVGVGSKLYAKPQHQAEQEPVLQGIERYRMQMAGISSAALGYWKNGDSIHPDYDTPALRDVACLYAKYAKLYAAPVRTKDLTDDEILKALGAKSYDECSERELADAILDARAVIAADRRKNQ